MMTSTAFASNISSKNIKPGETVKFAYTDFYDQNKLYVGGLKAADQGTAKFVVGDAGAGKIMPKSYKISTSSSTAADVPVTYYAGEVTKLGAPWSGGAVYSNVLASGFAIYGDKNIPNGASKDTDVDIDAAKKQVDRVARQNIQGYDFTSQNFRATLKAGAGQNLVKSVTFDGSGNLVVTFKADFRLPSTNGAPDFVVQELTVQSTRDVKDYNGNTVLYSGRKFFVTNFETSGEGKFYNGGTDKVTVGVVTQDVQLYNGREETLNNDGEWYKYTNGDAYRATVKYDDTGLMVTGTVYSGDVTSFKVGSEFSQQVISILQNNPNAKIDVYPIVAKGFKTGFSVSIKPTMVAGAAADVAGNVEVLAAMAANNKKIYTVDNAGVVTPAAFTYNATTGNWDGRIPANGATLLVSDVALLGVTAAATTPGTTVTNPGTGFGLDVVAAIVK